MRWVTLEPVGHNYQNPFGVTVDADTITGFRCVSARSEYQHSWHKIVAVTVAGAEVVVDEYWLPDGGESWEDFKARTQQRVDVLTECLGVLT